MQGGTTKVVTLVDICPGQRQQLVYPPQVIAYHCLTQVLLWLLDIGFHGPVVYRQWMEAADRLTTRVILDELNSTTDENFGFRDLFFIQFGREGRTVTAISLTAV